jgi:hypothetical protein
VRTSPAAGAEIRGCAGQDEERPDAQRQDPHDQGAGMALGVHPLDRGSGPREQRTGTNLVAGWDRMGHEHAGHHQGAETPGPDGAVQGHAGEDGHARRWPGQRRGTSSGKERGRVESSGRGDRVAAAGHHCTAGIAVARGDRLGKTHTLRDAANNDRDRDDYGGARMRYAEGHLQPSEEHLADAEVHLKLVKAHLAVLEVAEQAEVNLSETVPPPTPRVPTKETGAVPTAPRKVPQRRAKMASAAKKKDSTEEPEVVFVPKGRASSRGANMVSPP